MKIYRMGKSASIGRHISDMVGFLVTPDQVDDEAVRHAWSYAVRYTAKGIDVPDYEAAAKMIMQRHPSWQCFSGTEVGHIFYQAAYAENDKPD